MARAPDCWMPSARLLARAFGVPDEVEMLRERQFMRAYLDGHKTMGIWAFHSYEGYNEVEGFFDGFGFGAANCGPKWDIEVTWSKEWNARSVSSRIMFEADHSAGPRLCGSKEHECSFRLARWLMRLGAIVAYDAVVAHFLPPFRDEHERLEWHLMVRENQDYLRW